MATSWDKVVLKTIDENKDRLNNISSEIWSNPELAYKEFHAHDLLTSFLSEEGFQVERNFVTATGFKATYECESAPAKDSSGGGDTPDDDHLNVCFLCEYDALAGVGHGAGHNLCSEASIASALAIKSCIKQKLFPGKVTVLGSPAENSGGTKISLIKAGAFSDVDFAMMVSPMNNDLLYPHHYALLMMKVSYKGKAAHASAYPWEGRNALDAAVACYTNIALLRQQLKPTWMINGIITKGGTQPNIIPEEAEMSFWLRAPEHTDLLMIEQKCTACFVGAAKSTGCEVEYSVSDTQYFPMQHSTTLGEMYSEHARELGITFTQDPEALTGHTGSTDMGNVSQIVPCLCPGYNIGTRIVTNSQGFHEAAGTPEAQEMTLQSSKAMALTAAHVLSKPEVMSEVYAEYKAHTTIGGRKLLVQHTRCDSITRQFSV